MEKAIQIDKEAQLYRISKAAEDMTLKQLTIYADLICGVAFFERGRKKLEKRGARK